ncbi:MAG: helix-hairpin-helix domain-containing protein, partial [Syntrophales bacterium]
VFSEDRAKLTRIPGVGKKMAERIILELRDRLVKIDTETAEQTPRDKIAPLDVVREEVLSALVNLGYKRNRAKTVVDRVFDEAPQTMNLEQALKKALRLIS